MLKKIFALSLSLLVVNAVAINVGKAALIVAGVAAAFTLLAFIFVPKT